MKRFSTSTLLAAGVGLACAVILIWLWRHEATSTAPTPPTPTANTAAPLPSERPVADTPTSPGLTPEQSALLARLQQVLLAGTAREREAVLSFKDDQALRHFLERAQRSGLTVLGQLAALRAVRVRFDSVAALQRDLLANGDDYTDLAGNGLFGIPRPPATQDRPTVEQVPFGNDMLSFLGATGDRASWGRGTTIAILDTGVGGDATFGTGRIRPLDIGLGLVPGNGDEDGHGTAVAALAAGRSPDAAGLAPGADVVSIRVTDASGVSDLFTISQAIVTAVDAGARIVNVSLGGYATGAVLDAAIRYAEKHGALIVAAAGNDQAAQLAWPAADPRVISVGAIDKAEQQVSFSNSGEQLQLTAPGYGVQTAWLDGQRVQINGTSASAPIVAGAIAALMSQNPNLSPRDAAALLARTANDAGAPGVDPAFGHGIINLATALNSSNLSYVDTAVSSHFFDAETGQMQFVLQNRSGRSVSGLSLNVSAGPTTTNHTVPSLAPGETYVAKLPVNPTTLQRSGSISFRSQLTNPPGVVDQQPANNTRASILSAPKPEN